MPLQSMKDSRGITVLLLVIIGVVMAAGVGCDQASSSAAQTAGVVVEAQPASEPASPVACCAIDDALDKTSNCDESKLPVSVDTPTPANTGSDALAATTPAEVFSPSPPANSSVENTHRASSWIQPGDREAFYLDFGMTDQDGHSLQLSDLVGQPIAMSFIFTRCPNPNMCPLITLQMTNLQQNLKSAGLGDQVKLVLLSYDPTYDTPTRLKQYASQRGLEFTNATVLRPDADDFRELLDELQIGVNYRPDGSIGHFIELLLIDRQGRFVRDYQGGIWDNTAVMEDLKELASEAVLMQDTK